MLAIADAVGDALNIYCVEPPPVPFRCDVEKSTMRAKSLLAIIVFAFAALATAEQSKGFSCDLVGTTPLAKGYGLFRIYSLDRAAV